MKVTLLKVSVEKHVKSHKLLFNFINLIVIFEYLIIDCITIVSS